MRCVAMKKQFQLYLLNMPLFQYEGQSQESLKDVKLIIKSGGISCYYWAERMWKRPR